MKIRRVAGCIPILLSAANNNRIRRLLECPLGDTECVNRVDLTGSKLLLINSRKNAGKYVFPKGGLKKQEDPLAAALRETLEETGVEGHVLDRIHSQYWDWYILKVHTIHDDWKERDQRERIWVDYEEALHARPLTKGTKHLIQYLYKAYPPSTAAVANVSDDDDPDSSASELELMK